MTPNYFNFYFFSLLIFISNAEWNPKDFQKREHSLVKPFTGTGFGVPNWDFLGSTMVTSNYIRLTPDERSRQGAIWNKVPCRVRNWEVQLSFKVTGSTKDLFGDGFAFWYVRDRMQAGPVFGSKDQFSGLAIIADTYSNHNGPHNHQHPYLSVMVNNGSLSYDHDRDGTHTMLGGCEVKFRNKPHETVVAVRYEGDRLTLSHDFDNRREWSPCFSIDGVTLPTGYFFGVSATTGDLSDAHDIVSLKTYELDTAEGVSREERGGILPAAQLTVAPRDHTEDPVPAMSGWKKFLLALAALIGLAVCGVVGMMIYQNRQDNQRKRFY